MDPITSAIVAALSAGAASGLTEVSKAAMTDAYGKLKDILNKKFAAKGDVGEALDKLEAKPESDGRRQTLQEELLGVKAEQDSEVLTAAQHLLTLVQPQQAGLGKYTIQNNALVQGQNIGDYQQITQQFGNPPQR